MEKWLFTPFFLLSGALESIFFSGRVNYVTMRDLRWGLACTKPATNEDEHDALGGRRGFTTRAERAFDRPDRSAATRSVASIAPIFFVGASASRNGLVTN